MKDLMLWVGLIPMFVGTIGPEKILSVGSPVRISPNGRYFLDKRGKPCFWLGDTQWELFMKFTAEDAGTLLEDRRSKGFNVMEKPAMRRKMGPAPLRYVTAHTGRVWPVDSIAMDMEATGRHRRNGRLG